MPFNHILPLMECSNVSLAAVGGSSVLITVGRLDFQLKL